MSQTYPRTWTCAASSPLNAGESWEGKDHQYSFLWHLAQELFGGSMSMRLVKTLVQAYFRAPTTL